MYDKSSIFNQLVYFIITIFFLQTIVELNPAYRDYTERTENVDQVLRDMMTKGLFAAALKGMDVIF